MNEPVILSEQAVADVADEGPPPWLSAALAGYPHLANCSPCRAYAAARADLAQIWTLVAATLGHHDSGHHCDSFLAASQHFGGYPD